MVEARDNVPRVAPIREEEDYLLNRLGHILTAVLTNPLRRHPVDIRRSLGNLDAGVDDAFLRLRDLVPVLDLSEARDDAVVLDLDSRALEVEANLAQAHSFPLSSRRVASTRS